MFGWNEVMDPELAESDQTVTPSVEDVYAERDERLRTPNGDELKRMIVGRWNLRAARESRRASAESK
ncbi:hypothetical protein EVJ58_g4951 [Rhodofomes roseus]|uniref:Uncharacterized protein n=1 Tax=Rhodofomes roseus TaxID=34475 RepID=A0A4Y9YEX4_9APHY|nr:hypothetical protein EVJ58_g4951 [Rhodofomes roseus]